MGMALPNFTPAVPVMSLSYERSQQILAAHNDRARTTARTSSSSIFLRAGIRILSLPPFPSPPHSRSWAPALPASSRVSQGDGRDRTTSGTPRGHKARGDGDDQQQHSYDRVDRRNRAHYISYRNIAIVRLSATDPARPSASPMSAGTRPVASTMRSTAPRSAPSAMRMSDLLRGLATIGLMDRSRRRRSSTRSAPRRPARATASSAICAARQCCSSRSSTVTTPYGGASRI